MNLERANILNKNPETEAITDLIETGTPEQAQAALNTSTNLGNLYLLHTYTATRHSLAVTVGRTPEAAALAAPIKNVKWNTRKGETCPIPNPTIATVLNHA
jgi:hypothetical protein